MISSPSIRRRDFLRALTLAGIAAPFVTRDLLAKSPNGMLYHASFGAAGMAGGDINAITANKFVKLVAVADVDLERTAKIKEKFPETKIYQDFRELLDKEGKQLDSVNVSTPDHMHGPIAMTAMGMGKHVYCQKPMAHDIFEVRQLTEYARSKKLITQMGIQIHSSTEYRMAVQFVQEGVIGKIKEVHTWSNKKWGDPDPRPETTDPVPANFNWDLWLGVMAERPFIGKGYYHPSNWRKRLDFGTGTFGDMGCHIYDPVFKALALTAPLSVRSKGPVPTAHNWAINALIEYVFPGTPYSEGKTVKVTWYDGDQKPPQEVQALLGAQRKLPPQGSIFIGTNGIMLLPHIAKPELFPDEKFDTFKYPVLPPVNHYTQFAEACIGKGKTSANFDYAGPLTEAVLLGGVATRYPETTLEWNSKKLSFSNKGETSKLIRRSYRKGWEVKGL
jgi:predicted dehydrogenase